jgi:hypothetical protein
MNSKNPTSPPKEPQRKKIIKNAKKPTGHFK